MDDIEERNLDRDEKAFYEAGGMRGTKPKSDEYDRDARRLWRCLRTGDNSESEWLYELARLLRRVAKRAYAEGHKAGWVRQQKALKELYK